MSAARAISTPGAPDRWTWPQALRSPGSTLKPFIYGLAFEDGIVHPETLIDDRAVRYGAYAPENFDDAFHGTVTVRTALQQSLNVPALQILNAVGPDRLVARLANAGVKLVLPQQRGTRPCRRPRRRGRAAHRSRRASTWRWRAAASPCQLIWRAQDRRTRRAAAPPDRAQRRLDDRRRADRRADAGECRGRPASPSRPAPPTATAMPGPSAMTAPYHRRLGRPAGRIARAGPRRPHAAPRPSCSRPSSASGRGARHWRRHPADTSAPAPRRNFPQPCSASARRACRKWPRAPRRRRRSPSPSRPMARASIFRAMAVIRCWPQGLWRHRRPSPGWSTACRSLSGEFRRDAFWDRPGRGFARLSVIDAKGKTATARIRVE